MLGAIITTGVKLPHGMDGYNTQTKTFVRWVEGVHEPVSAPCAMQAQSLFVHGKHLTWNVSGYYEMSAKNSSAYVAKIRAEPGFESPHLECTVEPARPKIKHVAFQAGLNSHCTGKVAVFEKGACVCVTGGIHCGTIGIVQGPAPSEASCYVVRTIDSPVREVHVSYLHLCHHRTIVDLCDTTPQHHLKPTQPATAGDAILNQTSDSSIVLDSQASQQHRGKPQKASMHASRQRLERQLRNCPLVPGMQQYLQQHQQHPQHQLQKPSQRFSHYFSRGSLVRVVKGTYLGCRGEVQGVARAGKKVLAGQYSVLVEHRGGVLVVLSASFLQPWSAAGATSSVSSSQQSPSSAVMLATDLCSPVRVLECSVASEMISTTEPLSLSAPATATLGVPSLPPQLKAPMSNTIQATVELTPLQPQAECPLPSKDLGQDLELRAEDFIGLVKMLQSESEGEGEGEMRCTTTGATATADHSFPLPCPESLVTADLLQNTHKEEPQRCGLQALAQISAIYADAGDLTALTGLFMFK